VACAKAWDGFDPGDLQTASKGRGFQEQLMMWNGQERRSGKDRRKLERRRTSRYDVETLIIVDGITWIDPAGSQRRQHVRRFGDRESLARRITEKARP